MGQVPKIDFVSYLIVGAGRVSRHFQNYFTKLSIPFSVWQRTDGDVEFRERSSRSSHILLLINDSQIDLFYRQHEALLSAKSCVHFSGALVSDLVASAHPLMTFADSLYELQMYESLPFVLEESRGDLSDYLPGLKNPSFKIPAAQKSLYHSLCVMSGNFTVLLWEKVFADFEKTLGLPKQILLPYLLQTTENLALAPSGVSVLTGPLARGDQKTIEKNLRALEGDSFNQVYKAFLNSYEGAIR